MAAAVLPAGLFLAGPAAAVNTHLTATHSTDEIRGLAEIRVFAPWLAAR